MWLVGVRDLQWRRRRYAIGVAAIALVFAVTLLLAGVSAFFTNEVRRTVRVFDVDRWVVPKGTAGPFTAMGFMPAARVDEVRKLPGVGDAAPLVLFGASVRLPRLADVNAVGYRPGRVGAPAVGVGRGVEADGEMVVDRSLGEHVGHTIDMQGRTFKIVGLTHGITYFGGTPVVFMSLEDAQRVLFAGQPLATVIVTRGVPQGLPSDLTALSNSSVRSDLHRPLTVVVSTITFVDVLLWVIAAGIVAAILYMSALERVTDFAVLKATGGSNRFVMMALASQAIVLTVASALGAIVIAWLLTPLFPIRVEIPLSAYSILFGTAVVVGLVGSAAGLRRAISVDPALAFGG